MNDILKKIRTDLRLSMNGIVSASMREKGMDYRMNFGVDVPKLKLIAQKYEPDVALAEMLWKIDTRELKILATMLFPPEKLNMETANNWCSQIPNQEIREQICMNLFQKSVIADEMVDLWVRNHNDDIRATAYWLYARLWLSKSETTKKINHDLLVKKAIEDVVSPPHTLRTAAQNALKFAGRNSKETAAQILTTIKNFENDEDWVKNEIFNALSFEFTHFE